MRSLAPSWKLFAPPWWSTLAPPLRILFIAANKMFGYFLEREEVIIVFSSVFLFSGMLLEESSSPDGSMPVYLWSHHAPLSPPPIPHMITTCNIVAFRNIVASRKRNTQSPIFMIYAVNLYPLVGRVVCNMHLRALVSPWEASARSTYGGGGGYPTMTSEYPSAWRTNPCAISLMHE